MRYSDPKDTKKLSLKAIKIYICYHFGLPQRPAVTLAIENETRKLYQSKIVYRLLDMFDLYYRQL
jgi:hypothetical protein